MRALLVLSYNNKQELKELYGDIPFYDNEEMYKMAEKPKMHPVDASILELIKGLVRPFLIGSGWLTWLFFLIDGREVPAALATIIGIITLEYFGERAYLRLGGKIEKN